MISMVYKAGVVVLGASLLLGCSSSGGNGGSTGGAGGALSAADGTWVRPCLIDDVNINLSEGVYEVNTLVVNRGAFSNTALSFSDSACTEPVVPHEFVLSGTFAYPGGTVATSLGEAQFLDSTATSATLDGVPPPVNVFPIVTYDIFLVSGDSLYFGLSESDESGETPATRPMQIDTEYFYTRQ